MIWIALQLSKALCNIYFACRITIIDVCIILGGHCGGGDIRSQSIGPMTVDRVKVGLSVGVASTGS